MAQIELKFESFEDMKEFAEKFLGVADEQAYPVYRESKGTNGAQSAAPIQQTPVAVPPVQPAVPVQTTPVQTAAPVQVAPVAPVQVAPVAPVVPTVEHTYTLDELANAAMTLMDKGMQNQLQELLASYGVEALPALPREMYGNFATALRGMGANI